MVWHGIPGQLGWLAAALALPVVVSGCRSAVSQRQRLDSPNPLDQAEATVCLAEAGDAGAVHKLVGLLESRDRAVRMYAILALERLCGQTYGYVYYQPEAERAPAVRRWREALRRGEVAVKPRPPAGPPESPAGASSRPAERPAAQGATASSP